MDGTRRFEKKPIIVNDSINLHYHNYETLRLHWWRPFAGRYNKVHVFYLITALLTFFNADVFIFDKKLHAMPDILWPGLSSFEMPLFLMVQSPFYLQEYLRACCTDYKFWIHISIFTLILSSVHNLVKTGLCLESI